MTDLRIAPGVILRDVSARLARTANVQYRNHPVERLFVHHSGALGAPGFAGLANSTRYVVEERNFPCPAYHFWIPYEPVLLTKDDGTTHMVLFRAASDNTRTWHTGARANTEGLGIALQGNTTQYGLSAAQEEGLEALVPYLYELHGLSGPDALSGHWEAKKWGARRNKTSCPGAGGQAWVEAWRADQPVPAPNA